MAKKKAEVENEDQSETTGAPDAKLDALQKRIADLEKENKSLHEVAEAGTITAFKEDAGFAVAKAVSNHPVLAKIWQVGDIIPCRKVDMGDNKPMFIMEKKDSEGQLHPLRYNDSKYAFQKFFVFVKSKKEADEANKQFTAKKY